MKISKFEKTADAAYRNIAEILEEARATAYRAVNSVMVQAYWQIGRVIVEEEQRGRKRADYGKALIVELARRLTESYGKGFIERNLWYMRDFYLTFPNVNALRSGLSWTHYRLLLKVNRNDAKPPPRAEWRRTSHESFFDPWGSMACLEPR